MTNFNQLELLYDQFINISKEINELIANEDFDAAHSKALNKDKLLKKLIRTRKTVEFTTEEKEKIKLIDKKIQSENKELIEKLKITQDELGMKINKTKNKVKISSAYEITTKKSKGRYIDTFE